MAYYPCVLSFIDKYVCYGGLCQLPSGKTKRVSDRDQVILIIVEPQKTCERMAYGTREKYLGKETSLHPRSTFIIDRIWDSTGWRDVEMS